MTANFTMRQRSITLAIVFLLVWISLIYFLWAFGWGIYPFSPDYGEEIGGVWCGVYELRIGATEWLVRRDWIAMGPTTMQTRWEVNPARLVIAILVSIGAILPLWWVHSRLVSHLMLPMEFCDACGYDLCGSDSGRCPECGEPGRA